MGHESGADRRARKAERRAENIRKAFPGSAAAEKRAQKAERRAENIRNYARLRASRREAAGIHEATDQDDHDYDGFGDVREHNEPGQHTIMTETIEQDQHAGKIQALLWDIVTSPEIRDIHLGDPRFRWLTRSSVPGGGPFHTLGELLDGAVRDYRINRMALIEQLEHLKQFLAEQRELTLEEELFAIVSPLTKDPAKVPGLLARLGWSGEDPVTLQAAADRAGVTRERIRQLQVKLEDRLSRQPVWTPVLQRALRVVAVRLPMSEADVGVLLKRTGICTSEAFSAEGLLKAAELFRLAAPYALRAERGTVWLHAAGDADQLGYIGALSLACQKAVSREGIVPLARVIQSLREDEPELLEGVDDDALCHAVKTFDHLVLLEDRWLVQAELSVRNTLVNRLNKMLSVWQPLPMAWAVRQLGRERRERRELTIDEEALRAFVEFRPEYELADGAITTRERLDPAETLSDSEHAFRDCIVQRGGVATFADLSEVAEAIGLTRVTAAVTLKYSPIFFKLTRNEHRTIGDHAAARQISLDDLLDDLEDDDIAVDMVEHVIEEILDEQDADAPGTPDDEPEKLISRVDGPRLSVPERDAARIRKAIKTALKTDGIATLDAILAQHNSLYRSVTLDDVREVVEFTAEFALVGEIWVTSHPAYLPNPLSEAIRALLVWVNPLPVDLAVRQLNRARAKRAPLTRNQVVALVHIDDKLALEHEAIAWPHPLSPEDVTTRDELRLADVLFAAREPLGLAEIRQQLATSGGDIAGLQGLLASSVLFDEVGRHRYVLFGGDLRKGATSMEPEPEAAPIDETLRDDAGQPHEDTTAPTAPDHQQMPEDEDASDRLEDRIQEPAPSMTLQPSTTGSMQTVMASMQDLVTMARKGALQLPEIQREYVWKSAQVVKLLDSMYRNYPIGSMLIWHTEQDLVSRGMPGMPLVTTGTRSFLLDGQQRLTSFLRLLDSNEPDMRFNPFTEEFRIATASMRQQPQWLSVHGLLTRSTSAILRESGLVSHEEIEEIERRVDRLHRVLSAPIPVNQLHGFGYEEVSEIFVRVNSQGTRLKTAELAVANLAFQLPGLVSIDLARLHEELLDDGWDIPTLVILRILNGVATGQSRFATLAKADRATIEQAWPRTADGLRYALSMIRRHLGIESSSWLPTLNALVVPVAWHAGHDVSADDEREVMDWFIRASVFSRYTGPIETNLNQDLKALRESKQPFALMIGALRSTVGNFRITQGDLESATWQSAWSLLYWLTLRRLGAVDLKTGAILGGSHLGGGMEVTRHQLFPRSRTPGLTSAMANQLANVVLLAQAVETTSPDVFLEGVPGEWLRRQCVPEDPELWKPRTFKQFLEARRRLLVREMTETLQIASKDGLFS